MRGVKKVYGFSILKLQIKIRGDFNPFRQDLDITENEMFDFVLDEISTKKKKKQNDCPYIIH